MKPLTDKQRRVLQLIAEKVKDIGYPPTLQELADDMGVSSKNAVLKHNRISQLGTQIHASENYRRVVEWVQSGQLGKIAIARCSDRSGRERAS